MPLGFSAPGLIPAGARVPQMVELIDVLPTLLDLVGVAKPAEQHGKSLVPYLERPGAAGRGRPAFSEYGSSTIHTVLQDNWKLVHNPEGFNPICIPDAPPNHYPIGKEELYDLARDPGERVNLAAKEPAKVAELARLLERRFAGLRNRVRDQKVPGGAEEGAQLARLRGALKRRLLTSPTAVPIISAPWRQREVSSAVRAPALHAGGRGFKSLTSHQR